MDKKQEQKGGISMNACAVKPTLPFVTKGVLKRTPISQEHKNMVEFMDSHNFSIDINVETGEFKSTVTDKK